MDENKERIEYITKKLLILSDRNNMVDEFEQYFYMIANEVENMDSEDFINNENQIESVEKILNKFEIGIDYLSINPTELRLLKSRIKELMERLDKTIPLNMLVKIKKFLTLDSFL